MRVPLEISFHGLSRNTTLERQIHEEVEKLERICDHMVSCRIGIKCEQKRWTAGDLYKIRIEMRVPPGHVLVVSNTSGVEQEDADLATAMKSAFKSAQRRLRGLVQKQQGKTKRHPDQEVNGLISEVFLEEGYGFLRGLDGEEIYFHRNSVVNEDFSSLQPGIGVNFITEMGDKGLQASSVQVIDKPSGLAP